MATTATERYTTLMAGTLGGNHAPYVREAQSLGTSHTRGGRRRLFIRSHRIPPERALRQLSLRRQLQLS